MELLKGSAVVAFVVGFWDKIKTFLWMILSTFIQKIEIKSEDAHDTIIAYLITNHTKLSSYDKIYGAQYESFKSGKYGLVPYEKFGKASIIFFTNSFTTRKFLKLIKFPFYFSHTNPNSEGGNESPHSVSEYDKTYSYILCLRGTLKFDKIVENAVIGRNRISWNIDENEDSANRFNIYYFPEREYRGGEHGGNNVGYVWYWRVTRLIEHSTSQQPLWSIDSFVLRNPPLRQAAYRCNYKSITKKNNYDHEKLYK